MLNNLYLTIGKAGYLLLGAADGAGGAGASGASGSAFGSLLPFALIFLVMYLLIIRPQSKKQKAHREMIRNVAKGAKVITAGGVHGTVVQVNDKTIVVKVDDTTKIEFNKESVSTVIGEAKTESNSADKAETSTPKKSRSSKAKKETPAPKAENEEKK